MSIGSILQLITGVSFLQLEALSQERQGQWKQSAVCLGGKTLFHSYQVCIRSMFLSKRMTGIAAAVFSMTF